ncbi:NADPH:quinone reductase-like Zn-dependent oxidoreductase [Hymenobacter luteus]|uniref:NADPH:quinone reductase-like Zn-dependent oxidoreductase n=2 Tax=Hymenobacter TaxID=89966 RepID=A0A7W9SZ70_9BACT|nr:MULTISPECIES: NAD(P)-dependent alcohol dehydrogenase [Hymenobacter]MBB4601161.1 NADPH:quinone reductase-like Zn-dependent oxidoreductase [Hymenobacter latericoloratus]MBB6058632.1 NADPH:quinone reductase-like Zn-dependent oxidoreductase [Hymenobacter luteus]
MKAYKLHGPKSLANFTLGDYNEPAVRDQEVKIQVKAVSLNYRDWALANGWFGYPGEQLPFIPFSDGAGVVVEVGRSVTKFRAGDRVAVNFFPDWHDGAFSGEKTARSLGGSTDGVLAEYVSFPEQAVAKVPDSFSFEEAAAFPCAGVTAWHALVEQARLKPTDTLLLQGTGGVSIFGLQIARLLGARTIITSSSDEKLARARELGADLLINYKQTPNWDEKARELTQGAGVTYVLEVAGQLARSIRALQAGGSIFQIGAVGGPHEEAPNLGMLPINTQRLQGIYVGSTQMLTDLMQAFDRNGLRPVISQTFAFEQAKEALAYMGSGSHFGKIVVRVG